MKNIIKIAYVPFGLYYSSLQASAVTEPFHNADMTTARNAAEIVKPIVNNNLRKPGETTKQMLERILIASGDLKPGEQLALHEVWRMAEALNALADQRKQSQK